MFYTNMLNRFMFLSGPSSSSIKILFQVLAMITWLRGGINKYVGILLIVNYALRSVALPSSLVAILDYAFRGCYVLQTAIIPT